jgi:signal transduction histidine kinase
MIFNEYKRVAVFAAMAAVAFSGATVWAAGEHASTKEAEAMVKKGIAFIKANGKDKGYAEITNKEGQFKDRDLYLMVVQMDGVILAHGVNPKLVGLNRWDAKGIDGKFAAREMIEASKGKNGTWTEYKYTNPASKKLEDKMQYCEHLDDTAIVCGGVYKP